jgi:NAD(P)H-flavin reductase
MHASQLNVYLPDDILLRQELESVANDSKGRFQIWYTVDRVDPTTQIESWKYSTGFISKSMVEERLTVKGGTTQYMMCGPPAMIKFACVPALTELGLCEKDWVIF